MKKVSLILTTYNCKENLINTLESIENQDYPDIEVVIKDGGSTDGTIDIIKKYQSESCHTVVWKSNADGGIYDAMNQGYLISSGDIIAFFNDRFVGTDTISKLMNQMVQGSNSRDRVCVGVHADLVYMKGNKIIRKWEMGQGNIYQGWMPGHPTLFLKRDIYEKYGLYDVSYKISADYEFMIRFLKDAENELAYLPETVISMYYGGTSTDGLKGYMRSFYESYRALKTNKIRGAEIIIIKRIIRTLLQFKHRS